MAQTAATADTDANLASDLLARRLSRPDIHAVAQTVLDGSTTGVATAGGDDERVPRLTAILPTSEGGRVEVSLLPRSGRGQGPRTIVERRVSGAASSACSSADEESSEGDEDEDEGACEAGAFESSCSANDNGAETGNGTGSTASAPESAAGITSGRGSSDDDRDDAMELLPLPWQPDEEELAFQAQVEATAGGVGAADGSSAASGTAVGDVGIARLLASKAAAQRLDRRLLHAVQAPAAVAGPWAVPGGVGMRVGAMLFDGHKWVPAPGGVREAEEAAAMMDFDAVVHGPGAEDGAAALPVNTAGRGRREASARDRADAGPGTEQRVGLADGGAGPQAHSSEQRLATLGSAAPASAPSQRAGGSGSRTATSDDVAPDASTVATATTSSKSSDFESVRQVGPLAGSGPGRNSIGTVAQSAAVGAAGSSAATSEPQAQVTKHDGNGNAGGGSSSMRTLTLADLARLQDSVGQGRTSSSTASAAGSRVVASSGGGGEVPSGVVTPLAAARAMAAALRLQARQGTSVISPPLGGATGSLSGPRTRTADYQAAVGTGLGTTGSGGGALQPRTFILRAGSAAISGLGQGRLTNAASAVDLPPADDDWDDDANAWGASGPKAVATPAPASLSVPASFAGSHSAGAVAAAETPVFIQRSQFEQPQPTETAASVSASEAGAPGLMVLPPPISPAALGPSGRRLSAVVEASEEAGGSPTVGALTADADAEGSLLGASGAGLGQSPGHGAARVPSWAIAAEMRPHEFRSTATGGSRTTYRLQQPPPLDLHSRSGSMTSSAVQSASASSSSSASATTSATTSGTGHMRSVGGIGSTASGSRSASVAATMPGSVSATGGGTATVNAPDSASAAVGVMHPQSDTATGRALRLGLASSMELRVGSTGKRGDASEGGGGVTATGDCESETTPTPETLLTRTNPAADAASEAYAESGVAEPSLGAPATEVRFSQPLGGGTSSDLAPSSVRPIARTTIGGTSRVGGGAAASDTAESDPLRQLGDDEDADAALADINARRLHKRLQLADAAGLSGKAVAPATRVQAPSSQAGGHAATRTEAGAGPAVSLAASRGTDDQPVPGHRRRHGHRQNHNHDHGQGWFIQRGATSAEPAPGEGDADGYHHAQDEHYRDGASSTRPLLEEADSTRAAASLHSATSSGWPDSLSEGLHTISASGSLEQREALASDAVNDRLQRSEAFCPAGNGGERLGSPLARPRSTLTAEASPAAPRPDLITGDHHDELHDASSASASGSTKEPYHDDHRSESERVTSSSIPTGTTGTGALAGGITPLAALQQVPAAGTRISDVAAATQASTSTAAATGAHATVPTQRAPEHPASDAVADSGVGGRSKRSSGIRRHGAATTTKRGGGAGAGSHHGGGSAAIPSSASSGSGPLTSPRQLAQQVPITTAATFKLTDQQKKAFAASEAVHKKLLGGPSGPAAAAAAASATLALAGVGGGSCPPSRPHSRSTQSGSKSGKSLPLVSPWTVPLMPSPFFAGTPALRAAASAASLSGAASGSASDSIILMPASVSGSGESGSSAAPADSTKGRPAVEWSPADCKAAPGPGDIAESDVSCVAADVPTGGRLHLDSEKRLPLSILDKDVPVETLAAAVAATLAPAPIAQLVKESEARPPAAIPGRVGEESPVHLQAANDSSSQAQQRASETVALLKVAASDARAESDARRQPSPAPVAASEQKVAYSSPSGLPSVPTAKPPPAPQPTTGMSRTTRRSPRTASPHATASMSATPAAATVAAAAGHSESTARASGAVSTSGLPVLSSELQATRPSFGVDAAHRVASMSASPPPAGSALDRWIAWHRSSGSGSGTGLGMGAPSQRQADSAAHHAASHAGMAARQPVAAPSAMSSAAATSMSAPRGSKRSPVTSGSRHHSQDAQARTSVSTSSVRELGDAWGRKRASPRRGSGGSVGHGLLPPSGTSHYDAAAPLRLVQSRPQYAFGSTAKANPEHQADHEGRPALTAHLWRIAMPAEAGTAIAHSTTDSALRYSPAQAASSAWKGEASGRQREAALQLAELQRDTTASAARRLSREADASKHAAKTSAPAALADCDRGSRRHHDGASPSGAAGQGAAWADSSRRVQPRRLSWASQPLAQPFSSWPGIHHDASGSSSGPGLSAPTSLARRFIVPPRTPEELPQAAPAAWSSREFHPRSASAASAATSPGADLARSRSTSGTGLSAPRGSEQAQPSSLRKGPRAGARGHTVTPTGSATDTDATALIYRSPVPSPQTRMAQPHKAPCGGTASAGLLQSSGELAHHSPGGPAEAAAGAGAGAGVGAGAPLGSRVAWLPVPPHLQAVPSPNKTAGLRGSAADVRAMGGSTAGAVADGNSLLTGALGAAAEAARGRYAATSSGGSSSQLAEIPYSGLLLAAGIGKSPVHAAAGAGSGSGGRSLDALETPLELPVSASPSRSRAASVPKSASLHAQAAVFTEIGGFVGTKTRRLSTSSAVSHDSNSRLRGADGISLRQNPTFYGSRLGSMPGSVVRRRVEARLTSAPHTATAQPPTLAEAARLREAEVVWEPGGAHDRVSGARAVGGAGGGLGLLQRLLASELGRPASRS